MKRVLCLLADGFEEIELVTPVDLLRRAGADVVIAALGGNIATGRCGMRLVADAMLDDVDAASFDMLLIPGGPGVTRLREDGRAAALAKQFADAGKMIAAICAAPLVLKDAGLLAGRSFTAFDSVRAELGAGVVDERVVVDGNLITSRGAGTALDFALALVAHLFGDERAMEIRKEIMA
ncbi:MAG: DJ-1 family glyoxalase III [Verrucomicrobiota bacterium]